MEDYQFSCLMKLYLFGKKLQAIAKKHNSDRLSQTIILRLVNQKPQTVSHIAELLSIKVSAATSRVAEMEKMGLLSRSHDGDRRSHVVAITPAGEQAIAALKKAMSGKSGGHWFCLTRRQAKTLEALVDRIRLE